MNDIFNILMCLLERQPTISAIDSPETSVKIARKHREILVSSELQEIKRKRQYFRNANKIQAHRSNENCVSHENQNVHIVSVLTCLRVIYVDALATASDHSSKHRDTVAVRGSLIFRDHQRLLNQTHSYYASNLLRNRIFSEALLCIGHTYLQ